jgi:hypothetical protein
MESNNAIDAFNQEGDAERKKEGVSGPSPEFQKENGGH